MRHRPARDDAKASFAIDARTKLGFGLRIGERIVAKRRQAGGSESSWTVRRYRCRAGGRDPSRLGKRRPESPIVRATQVASGTASGVTDCDRPGSPTAVRVEDAAATSSMVAGVRHSWSLWDATAPVEQTETSSTDAATSDTAARRYSLRFARPHIGATIHPDPSRATAEMVQSGCSSAVPIEADRPPPRRSAGGRALPEAPRPAIVQPRRSSVAEDSWTGEDRGKVRTSNSGAEGA